MNQYEDFSEVVVHARGHVTASEQVYAHNAIARLAGLVDSVMNARVDLVMTFEPSYPCAHATAEVTVGANRLDAHAEAASVTAAVDALQAALRDQLGGGSVPIDAPS